MKKILCILVLAVFAVSPVLADEKKPDADKPVIKIGTPKDFLVFSMEVFYHEHYSPYKKIIDELPIKVEFEFYQKCEDLHDDLTSGKVDIAGSRIVCYLRGRNKDLLTPLYAAKIDGKLGHRGVLMVKKDSPYQKIEDLEGKRFSTVASDSIIYNYYPRYLVRKRTGKKIKDYFSEIIKCPTVPAAIYSVVLNQSDAVFADEEFIKSDIGVEEFRVIEETFEIPYPVLYARKNPEKRVIEIAETVYEAMQKLPVSERVGDHFRVRSCLTPVEDADYKDFRKFLEDNGLMNLVMND